MNIRRLHWDERNTAHIARHGVSPEEVEEVLRGKYVPGTAYGGRESVIGHTVSGRMLTLFLHNFGQRGYYPVTARDASRQERFEYARKTATEDTDA